MNRYPMPELKDVPEDIRQRILEVQEKSGFLPNVFAALSWRPAEASAFFAMHDALMDKETPGLSKACRELIVVATSAANDCLYCVVAHGAIARIRARDPFIADIQTPADETSLGALEVSPLENKQVAVNSSRYGATGRMVVNGVYAQGYTLDDVDCADANGTPPCVAGDYDHIYVFSFSRPADQTGASLAVGETVTGFTGGVSEFNGLTEIGFPQSFTGDDTTAHPEQVAPPVVVQTSWLTNPIMFERNEAGLIEVDGATLCPLDSDYTTYKQWKLDIGAGCGSPINIITSGVVDFDPSTFVGQVIPKVVGSLRPVNIGSFNVWIMYPRFAQDLTLP